MSPTQSIVVICYSVVSFIAFGLGIYNSITKRNPFGPTTLLTWLGIFVWGDALVIGLFWFLSALAALVMQSWVIFLLIISVFWVIRSVGETMYWLHQQFDKSSKYYEKVPGYGLIKSNAILFVYQIYWQCITVVSVIATMLLVREWLTA